MSQDLVHNRIGDSAPKSCVLDPVPTTLLKTYLNDLVPLICRTVNESLLSGSVSLQFKEAVVTPVPHPAASFSRKRPWCKQLKKNYRPVSILQFTSRLLMEDVLHQLRSHLFTRNICDSFQSAYPLPRYNHNGWLGLKHQVTYLLLHITYLLLTMRITLRRQLSYMSWTAFSVVLMKARCPFWPYLICKLRSIHCIIAFSSHGCLTCLAYLARISKDFRRTCLIEARL